MTRRRLSGNRTKPAAAAAPATVLSSRNARLRSNPRLRSVVAVRMSGEMLAAIDAIIERECSGMPRWARLQSSFGTRTGVIALALRQLIAKHAKPSKVAK